MHIRWVCLGYVMFSVTELETKNGINYERHLLFTINCCFCFCFLFINFLFLITSRGSVNAQMLALAIVNEHTSKAEALTQFIEGFDTSFKDCLGVSALIVAGTLLG